MKPELIGNRELRTLDALAAHLEWLHRTYARPVEISIAIGYFCNAGFWLLPGRPGGLSRFGC